MYQIGTPMTVMTPVMTPRQHEDDRATIDAPWLGLGGGSAGLEVAEALVTEEIFTHMMMQMEEYLEGRAAFHRRVSGDDYFEGHIDQTRVVNKKGTHVTLTVILMKASSGKCQTSSVVYKKYENKILIRGLSTQMMEDRTFKQMMKYLASFMWIGS